MQTFFFTKAVLEVHAHNSVDTFAMAFSLEFGITCTCGYTRVADEKFALIGENTLKAPGHFISIL